MEYGSRNVLADPELREGVKQFSSWPTIPQASSCHLNDSTSEGQCRKELKDVRSRQGREGVGAAWETMIMGIIAAVVRP